MTQIIQTIGLEGVKNFAYHGWYPEEQLIGCWFETHISVAFVASSNPQALSDTINYEVLNNWLQLEMQTPQKLLETVVQNILNRILAGYPKIVSAEIKLRKLHPPMPGLVGNSFVSLQYSEV